MIFKGRREKSIEPPNQTTLKHLLVESPCISLTSKPAPFFGTWLRSLALCLVSDLGRSEDRPPPNSETLPSKMCVYVYHICKAISKFVYVSEYFVFYFAISKRSSKQIPHRKLPIQTGLAGHPGNPRKKTWYQVEHKKWTWKTVSKWTGFPLLNSPHSCVLNNSKVPPTPSTTPRPTSPTNTWDQETFKDSAPPLKLLS